MPEDSRRITGPGYVLFGRQIIASMILFLLIQPELYTCKWSVQSELLLEIKGKFMSQSETAPVRKSRALAMLVNSEGTASWERKVENYNLCDPRHFSEKVDWRSKFVENN